MQLSQDLPEGHLFFRRCGAGSVTVVDREITRSFLLAPDALVEDWPVRSAADFDLAAVDALLALEPEVVLLGTGARQVFPPREAQVALDVERSLVPAVVVGFVHEARDLVVAERRVRFPPALVRAVLADQAAVFRHPARIRLGTTHGFTLVPARHFFEIAVRHRLLHARAERESGRRPWRVPARAARYAGPAGGDFKAPGPARPSPRPGCAWGAGPPPPRPARSCPRRRAARCPRGRRPGARWSWRCCGLPPPGS